MVHSLIECESSRHFSGSSGDELDNPAEPAAADYRLLPGAIDGGHPVKRDRIEDEEEEEENLNEDDQSDTEESPFDSGLIKEENRLQVRVYKSWIHS